MIARTCSVDDCDRPVKAREMCSRHYRQWRLDNVPGLRERDNASQQARRASNPEREAGYRRKHAERHAETERARKAAWRRANPWWTLLSNWRRRRREFGLPLNVVENVDPRVVFERDGNVCQLCMQPVDMSCAFPDPMAPTIDHVKPVSEADSEHSYANTQLAHHVCNQRKNDAQTHCKRGHELAGDNLQLIRAKSGLVRRCKACVRLRAIAMEGAS